MNEVNGRRGIYFSLSIYFENFFEYALKYRGKWNNIRVYFLNKFALIRNISYIDEKKIKTR